MTPIPGKSFRVIFPRTTSTPLKRSLEIKCIHLDGGLDGAMEVNDAAMNANLKGQIAKAAGGAYVDTKALTGPMAILSRYCVQNGVSIMNSRVFKWINRACIAAQIIFAVACFCIFIQY
mgnify:CR=1 FL=1